MLLSLFWSSTLRLCIKILNLQQICKSIFNQSIFKPKNHFFTWVFSLTLFLIYKSTNCKFKKIVFDIFQILFSLCCNYKSLKISFVFFIKNVYKLVSLKRYVLPLFFFFWNPWFFCHTNENGKENQQTVGETRQSAFRRVTAAKFVVSLLVYLFLFASFINFTRETFLIIVHFVYFVKTVFKL